MPVGQKNEYGLTAQQEQFAVLVATGTPQRVAYETAFPALATKWPKKTRDEKASRLAALPAVRERIQIMMTKAAALNDVSVAGVIKDIQRLAAKAEADREWNAALRAQEMLGKHVGAFAEDNQQRNPLADLWKMLSGNVYGPVPAAAIPLDDGDDVYDPEGDDA